MDKQKLCDLLDKLRDEGKECEWLEFKKNYCGHEEIGKCLSALSNSSLICDEPFGYLVFGIRNSILDIEGTNFSFSKKKVGNEELENWLSNRLNPRIDFRPFEFDYEGKRVVIVEIGSAHDTPISFMKVEYIRVGSATRLLSDFPNKARKIWSMRNKKNFEEEIAMGNIKEQDLIHFLDYPAYFKFMKLPLPSGSEELWKKLDEERIIKISQDGSLEITNLGAILFAQDLRKFDRLGRKAIRIITYDGVNKIKAIREEEVTKGYAIGLNEFIKYIFIQLPSSEEIHKVLRKNVKVYPEIAIRELVVNMLIHQDLSIRGTGPMVEIFNDRIEFSNPGDPLVETLRFIDHTPKSRNEGMARLMRRMKMCEERGVGIDKVITKIELYQLPAPKFIGEKDSCKVIMYAPKELKNMSKDDRIRACYQHCCLKYISSETMTNKSLRERFGISASNYPMASRIINDTTSCKFIKNPNILGKSKKMARYVPFWA